MEFIILLLLLGIFAVEILKLNNKPEKIEIQKEAELEEETIDNEKRKKQEEFQKSFDNLMNYSITKAIESKGGE